MKSNAVLTTFLLILLTNETYADNYEKLQKKWQNLPADFSMKAEAKALENAKKCGTPGYYFPEINEIIRDIKKCKSDGSDGAFTLRVDVLANNVQAAIEAGIDVLAKNAAGLENMYKMFLLPEQYMFLSSEGYQVGYNTLYIKELLQLLESGGVAAAERQDGLYVFFAYFPLHADRALMYMMGKFEFRK